MAGDWMKVEHSTPDKPEVLAIASSLNISPDEAFGICFRMWRWFDLHTQKGNAVSVTTPLLNRLLGVSGFAEAALAVGWLEPCEIEGKQAIRVPNFDRHNGQTSKQRALTAKRVASHKEKTNAKGNAETVTDSVSDALPREEKRREEKNNKKTPTPFDLDSHKAEVPEAIKPTWMNWLAYKIERKEIYKPTGLKAAESRVTELCIVHGERAVVSAIQKAMANNWQGFEHDNTFGPSVSAKPQQPKPAKNYLVSSQRTA
jgi:hypothetical protein